MTRDSHSGVSTEFLLTTAAALAIQITKCCTPEEAEGRGSTGVSPKPSRVKRARLLYHSSRALVFYYAILFQHRFSSVFKAESKTG